MGVKSNKGSEEVLIDAMRRVALVDDPDTRKILYKTILKSRFFVPVPGRVDIKNLGNNNRVQFEKGDQIQLITGVDPHGRPAILVFTDRDELLKWRPSGSQFVILESQSLFRLAVHNEYQAIIVNPAGPIGGMLSRAEFEMLAEGSIPIGLVDERIMTFHSPSSKSLRPGPLSKLPAEDFIRALMSECRNIGAINRVYLFEASSKGGNNRLVIAIQLGETLDGSQVDSLVKQLVDVVQSNSNIPRYFDVMILGDDDYSQSVIKQADVIYSRSAE